MNPPPRMLSAMRIACAAALAALCLASPVMAQSATYRLDEQGRWVQESAPVPGSDEAVMAETRRLLAEGEVTRARATIDAWLDKNDRTPNAFLPEALLLRGDCKLADGEEYKAMLDYEEVARNYYGSEVFPLALERELEVSVLYLNGLRRKVFGLFRIDSGVPVAEAAIVRICERHPGSRLAERALLELGDYYYRTRDLRGASEVYDKFLELFPRSDKRMLALQRLIYANIAQFKGPRYDTATLIDARYQIDDFVRDFPARAEEAGLGPDLQARLEESRANHDLKIAQWYLRRNDPVSARLTLRRLVRQFPGTRSAREGLEILESRGWALDRLDREPEPSASPLVPPEPAAPPAMPGQPEPPSPGPGADEP